MTLDRLINYLQFIVIFESILVIPERLESDNEKHKNEVPVFG